MARRTGAKNRPTLRVTVEFVGDAKTFIEDLLEQGLDGPTMQLVVDGLALAQVRKRMRQAARDEPKTLYLQGELTTNADRGR